MGIRNSAPNVVESFFIQHSLPRFPKGPTQLYDSNLFFRAQHFFCVSMRDEFKGQDNLEISTIYPHFVKDTNFFKLLWKYATVIKIKDIMPPNIASVPQFQPVFNALTNNLKDPLFTEDLASFNIESTCYNNTPISIHVMAKSPSYAVDIYDDVTSLLSVHHEDYSDDSIGHLTGDPEDNKTAMLMITQSHTDPATLGINQRVLIDRPDFFATVHILNSAYIHLPVEGSENGHCQASMYKDHSKWSVNLIYGTEGVFPATLCFYDLNRSNKQANRGGGAFCLNSSLTGGTSPGGTALWNLFMSFGPKPTDMARFRNTPVATILDQIQPTWIDNFTFFNTASQSKSSRRKSIDKSPDFSMFSPYGKASVTPGTPGTDLDMDIVDDDRKAAEEAAILAAARARKQEKEDRILSKLSMTYLKFPRTEDVEKSKCKLLVIHAHNAHQTNRVFDKIPSPFKYDKNGKQDVLKDNVPSLVGLKISNYFYQYGADNLNELLEQSYKLKISSIKQTDTPLKNHSHLTEYAQKVSVPATAIKGKKKRKQEQDAEDGNKSKKPAISETDNEPAFRIKSNLDGYSPPDTSHYISNTELMMGYNDESDTEEYTEFTDESSSPNSLEPADYFSQMYQPSASIFSPQNVERPVEEVKHQQSRIKQVHYNKDVLANIINRRKSSAKKYKYVNR